MVPEFSHPHLVIVEEEVEVEGRRHVLPCRRTKRRLPKMNVPERFVL